MDHKRLIAVDFSKVLQQPFQQHQGVAVEHPTIGDLLCIYNRLSALVTTEGIGLPAAKKAILHAIVFHAVGCYQANLPPPPRTSAEMRTPAFA